MKNFDRIKGQMTELSTIVNAFKSEAVQLRVIELIFGDDLLEDEEAKDKPTIAARIKARGRKPRKAVLAKGNTDSQGHQRPTRNPGRGGRAILAKLYQEGFFKKPRTIREIVDHADTNLATKLKQSDFSGSLARYVRDGKLTRSKNAENQYEYAQS